MNISIKREQNNARISSAEREKFGAKLKTKNIFKTVALAMLMPAMLLTTACSNDDEAIVNNETTNKKGYPLQVTVNVSREGDAGTRASYNESTRTLSFSTGDKLFVSGNHYDADQFAGTLDYDAVSGKFSGTIYTESEYTGTIDDLMASARAVLLPNGYGSYGFLSIDGSGYDATVDFEQTKAFALTKAAAVEQFSVEQTFSYSSGFALDPSNAIANFTISGLTANKEVAVSFNVSGTVISGEVTTSATGVATFAVGVSADRNLEDCILTVDGNNIAMPTKTTEAGKIYNISRNAIPGALIGKFSVSSTDKVYFSKGNLQATYDGSNWTWAFAANQWDYIGNAAGNTMVTATSPFISENATVDLFGWVGASSTWTGVNKYGITSSSATNNTNGYGNVASESLKSDWGALIGLGWRTLSMDEWTYLLSTRTVNGGKGADKSYTINQSVNGKKGMVIYPDNYTGAVYSGDNWASFEAAGCVFLPAAGWRNGTTINNSINDRGYYWSTTPSNATAAKRMFFAGGLELDGDNSRAFGFSVRLVYNAN